MPAIRVGLAYFNLGYELGEGKRMILFELELLSSSVKIKSFGSECQILYVCLFGEITVYFVFMIVDKFGIYFQITNDFSLLYSTLHAYINDLRIVTKSSCIFLLWKRE